MIYVKIISSPRCLFTDEYRENVINMDIYIQNEILFSDKNNEILSFVATWMELEDVSQVQKDKYYMFSFICRN
jgi:hypothetical protein